MKLLSVLLLVTFSFSAHAMKLRFIGDAIIKSETNFKNTLLGGLSGAQYNKRDKLIYAVSDDRGARGKIRLYTFKFNITSDKFSVAPHNVKFLTKENGEAFALKEVDFEGFAFNRNGNFIISSEGNIENGEPPVIGLFSKTKGSRLKTIEVPKKFVPVVENNAYVQGHYNNAGPEGLSITPNFRNLFTAMEANLSQDGMPSTYAKTSPVRLVKYDANMKPQAEYVYTLSKVPATSATSGGGVGVSEILALSDKKILFLERAWLPDVSRNVIKVFLGEIRPSTTNVAGMHSLKGQKYRPMKKTLIANFDDYLPLMSGEAPRLDNMEAITLGPKLANGNQTIIFISDNNFSAHQKTLFMAFEIVK